MRGNLGFVSDAIINGIAFSSTLMNIQKHDIQGSTQPKTYLFRAVEHTILLGEIYIVKNTS